MIKLRRKYLFFVLFIFSSIILYSQTWKEVADVIGKNTLERELTVISGTQFNRLLEQYGEMYKNVSITYDDVLVMGAGSRVLSGTRPVFNGYYCLLIKEQTLVGVVIILAYGHPNTGRMEIRFSPYFNTEFNSNEFWKQYNRYYDWVNEE